jgi:hypothetical protein
MDGTGMSIPARRDTRIEYAPVGRCIYCGRDDCELKLEHIIPEALNGLLGLPKASCGGCENIINSYEHTVGRQIFGDFRIRYNLRSKRPKKRRPKTIEVEFHAPDGSRKGSSSRDPITPRLCFSTTSAKPQS